MLAEDQLAFILSRRLAHLATADADGRPHVVPVVFAYHQGNLWIAIDEKPKRTLRLKRLRNIEQNPKVALVFDRYQEDWERLAYVLVHGTAVILQRGDEEPGALAALRERYPQYRRMALEERPLIRITPERATSWGEMAGDQVEG